MRRAARTLLVALLLGACSPPGPRTSHAADPQVIEVFGPWLGDEADAFRSTLRDFESSSGLTVRYVGTAGFEEALPERGARGDLPDVAFVPQPAVLQEMADQTVALDGALEEEVRATWNPDLVKLTEHDGRLLGIWFRISVKSLVWYPPQVFAERGYDIPASWADVELLAAEMTADGFAPWCIGLAGITNPGWVATDWVEDLVLRLHGPEVYEDWVAGDIAFTDGRILEALELFATTTGGEAVYGGTREALNRSWEDAQAPMFEEPPGCLLHRQAGFNRGFLPAGTTVGVDRDTDVFVLPAVDEGIGAPLLIGGTVGVAFDDRPEVAQFMAWLASPRAGASWAARGGFVSPHPGYLGPEPTGEDLAARYPDPIDRRSAVALMAALSPDGAGVAFDGSDRMRTEIGTDAFPLGMLRLAAGTPARQVATDIELERQLLGVLERGLDSGPADAETG